VTYIIAQISNSKLTFYKVCAISANNVYYAIQKFIYYQGGYLHSLRWYNQNELWRTRFCFSQNRTHNQNYDGLPFVRNVTLTTKICYYTEFAIIFSAIVHTPFL